MEAIYDLKGADGRHLTVYADKVVLKVKANVGSILDGVAFNGEKIIYFVDCVGIQYKPSKGIMLGYLQFETASGMMHNKKSLYNSENSFIWDVTTKQTKAIMDEVVEYCKKRVDEAKANKNSVNTIIQTSPAEELKKFKELLDMGIISQEEFDAKKKQLLGL